jgi:hypothetical protein
VLPLVWAGRGSHAHAPTDALGAALDRLLAELAALDAPVAYLTLHDRSDRRAERRLGRLNLPGAEVHAAIVAWLTPLARAAATGGARCLRLRAFGPKGVHMLWSGTLRGAAAGLADGGAALVDGVTNGDADEVEVLRRAAELMEGSGRAVDRVVARVLRARAAVGRPR